MKRIWTLLKSDVDVNVAMKVLSEQKFFNANVPAPFAIQSKKSGKIYTDFKEDTIISFAETVSPWNILIVDIETEKKTQEIRDLFKNSNCSGYSWAKIDNMSLDEIWEYVSSIVSNEKMYKLLKVYFENNIYRNKN